MFQRVQSVTTYTAQEYFDREEQAEHRSEYIHGEIFAMAGGTANHSRVGINICMALATELQGQSCEPFNSDMRVEVRRDVMYCYPDAMVVCHPVIYADGRKDTLKNPTVIFEVLSKSTRNYDRTTKFTWYRELPTLQDYIMVDQDRVYIEHFHKLADGRWVLTVYIQLDSTLLIDTIGVAIPLERIYQRVDWLEESE